MASNIFSEVGAHGLKDNLGFQELMTYIDKEIKRYTDDVLSSNIGNTDEAFKKAQGISSIRALKKVKAVVEKDLGLHNTNQ